MASRCDKHKPAEQRSDKVSVRWPRKKFEKRFNTYFEHVYSSFLPFQNNDNLPY